MSIVELERPSPAAITVRHAVPARLHPLRSGGPAYGHEPFDDLAIVFPSRRLCGSATTTIARRRAAGFDARASATAWLIEEGLEALDPKRRLNVVQRWSEFRDQGASLVGDGGCDLRFGDGVVGTAERAALLAWLPLTRRELAVYEGGLCEDAPARALALLLRPPTVWALEEVLGAEQLYPRGRRFEPRRFAAIEQHAYGRITAEHESRLHRAVTRIAAQLPLERLPVASRTIASGCAIVGADDARARAVIARQLARYASSALAAACASDAA